METVLSKLEEYTGCTFVLSNTTKQMPAYPYGSFTVISVSTKKGTYAAATVERNGEKVDVLYMPALIKISFTMQSNDEDEALEKAFMIQDFFAEAKRLELEDNDIVVADIGAITNRDNMLTIEYEYRKGLDVTLRATNVIENTTKDAINKVKLTSDTVGDIDLEKE